MAALSYVTAGESHGPGLAVIVSGLPSGLEIDAERISAMIADRRLGRGRGARMGMEHDEVHVESGLLRGRTIGSPLCMLIPNADKSIDDLPPVTAPRPGHADLAGCLKYGLKDARAVLERASARETAARSAAGAVAMLLLDRFGVRVFSHVTAIGGIESRAGVVNGVTPEMESKRRKSPVFCLDSRASKAMARAIDVAQARGDTLGGLVEVDAVGVAPGVGGSDSRLDSSLAAAVMAIPSVKGVEIGFGFALASVPGSLAHDEIILDESGMVLRPTNRAGGIEGGISNGGTIVVRAAVKPIPTLGKPLRTFDLKTLKPANAARERADVCAVPAVSVVAGFAAAFEIAAAYRLKFGGDTLDDMIGAFSAYRDRIRILLAGGDAPSIQK